MINEIEYNGKLYTFYSEDLADEVNIETDISIDYSNIVGDMAYTVILSNRVGNLKAELEAAVRLKELEVKRNEILYKNRLRSDSAKNNGSFTITVDGENVSIKNTEKALEKAHYNSDEWCDLEKELIELQRQLSVIEQFYWKLESKIKRLEPGIKQLYPEGFDEEVLARKFNKLIEKKINN